MIDTHSGDFGDFIYCLAYLRYAKKKDVILCNVPGMVYRNIDEARFKNYCLFLETQKYLTNIFYSDNYQLSPTITFRHWMRWFSIIESHFYANGVSMENTLNYVRQTSWLDPVVSQNIEKKNTIFLFTPRRKFSNNGFFSLPRAFNNAVFIGVDEDIKYYKGYYKDKIECYSAANYLELAKIVSSAKVVIGNPSGGLALAQGFGVPTISIEAPWDKAIRFFHRQTLNLQEGVVNFGSREFLETYSFLREHDIDFDDKALFEVLKSE